MSRELVTKILTLNSGAFDSKSYEFSPYMLFQNISFRVGQSHQYALHIRNKIVPCSLKSRYVVSIYLNTDCNHKDRKKIEISEVRYSFLILVRSVQQKEC